jgi:tRNA nucleotidyltransferase/poly(A) polymerase
MVQDTVVGVGQSADQAQHMAKHSRFKEQPRLLFVSPEVQVVSAAARDPFIHRVFDLAQGKGISIYLVGGSVRDLLLGIQTHDLDFAVDGDGLAVARRIADKLGGAYVALDKARRTGRVVLLPKSSLSPGKSALYIDLASMRGDDLEADLRDRDFTINAMALARRDQELCLIDPLGGSRDLAAKVLRAASPTSFEHDPVRTLRAIRMHAQFGCAIEPQTSLWLRAAGPHLAEVSAERRRDEWFKILAQPVAADAIRTLHQFRLLQIIAPPVAVLDGREQPGPHRTDALTHALDTVGAIEHLWAAFQGHPTGMAAALSDDLHALGPRILARYRAQICDERTTLALLKCAALLHDVGNPDTQQVDRDGKSQTVGHEKASAAVAHQLAQAWRCSNAEKRMLRTTVEAHVRLRWLAQQPTLTRRAIYRYFQDTGPHGLDAALVALADYMATWGSANISDSGGQKQMATVAGLWNAYWDHRETIIDPPPLISGSDLIAIGVSPGTQIGRLLARVREGQAAGEIETRQDAIGHVKVWLSGG